MKHFTYVLLILFLSSCGKNDTSEKETLLPELPGTSFNAPGFGESEAAPSGTDWILPTGIQLVKRSHKPYDSNPSLLYGASTAFYADLNFVNTTNKEITVNVPCGLIFTPDPEMFHQQQVVDYQNGVLILGFTVTVPPTINPNTGGRDTTTVYAALSCLNAEKNPGWVAASSDEQEKSPAAIGFYKPVKVTNDLNLKKALELSCGLSKLRVQQNWVPATHDPDAPVPEWAKIYDQLQDLVWHVTDGRLMDSKDYQALLTALEKYR